MQIVTLPASPSPWPTQSPFLFCVHHRDAYPHGNGELGPNANLDGRTLGQDFSGRDGYSMYHGSRIPGFPRHPHRGFETLSLVRAGVVDHFDSLGATGRLGAGDAQWMTAGAGICHSEMFPLVATATPNPTELIQLWINLPARNKLAPPGFQVYWAETLPRYHDAHTAVTLYAGAWPSLNFTALPPPQHSLAAHANAAIEVWTAMLQPTGRLHVDASAAGVTRMLYVLEGELRVTAAGQTLTIRQGQALATFHEPLTLEASRACEVLCLGGRPLDEPVVAYGPFVMNSRVEIATAISDYQRTEFGGWPWPTPDPVHPSAAPRFARTSDGREATPPKPR